MLHSQGNCKVLFKIVPKPSDSSSKGISIEIPKVIVWHDLEQAHRIVLENSTVVQPYIQ